MSAASKIEWTDRSDWNPIRGCTRISEGCRNCYAETIAARFSGPGQAFEGFAKRTPNGPRWTGKIELIEDRLFLPLRWKKPARIFVNSAFDLFHEDIPDEWIDRIFAVMALAPQHTFQILTKRSKRMRVYMTKPVQGAWAGRAHYVTDKGHVVDMTDVHMRMRTAVCDLLPKVPPAQLDLAAEMQEKFGDGFMPRWPLPNVWLGVSIEDQGTADERIPDLLDTHAALRWISAEPLLGPVNLMRITMSSGIHRNVLGGTWSAYPIFERDGVAFINTRPNGQKIDWVVVGGESGRDARPMHPNWARTIRDQCAAAGVPFFFKQWGEWSPVEIDLDDECEFNTKTPAYPIKGCHDESTYPTNIETDARELREQLFGQNDETTLVEFWDLQQFPAIGVNRVGKRRAGRLLDGVEHNAMPETGR